MNSYLIKNHLIDYVKLTLLVIMFIFGPFLKATTGDYILLIVLLLIEFAFKIGFNYINSVNYTISNKFHKNILKMLNYFKF